jgi:hypothetical protein
MSIIKHYEGMYYNWRGHHEEHVVARHLHGVLYSNPSHPRYDLTVNGVPVQVKRGSWQNIRQHILHYGPTTVWVPTQGGNMYHYILDVVMLAVAVVLPTRFFSIMKKDVIVAQLEAEKWQDMYNKQMGICETEHKEPSFVKTLAKAAGLAGISTAASIAIATVIAMF